MTHVPTNHEIETASGRFVDLSDPDPATIHIEDIAHGLAMVCRYNGQASRFYSVAEHAVAVSRELERRGASKMLQIAGLHHDDAEAYLGDVTRPLKSLLQPKYGRLTNMMDDAIIEALNLPWDGDALHMEEVKEVDNFILLIEAKHLLPSEGANWAGNGCNWEIPDDAVADDSNWKPQCWTSGNAQIMYMLRHWELTR